MSSATGESPEFQPSAENEANRHRASAAKPPTPSNGAAESAEGDRNLPLKPPPRRPVRPIQTQAEAPLSPSKPLNRPAVQPAAASAPSAPSAPSASDAAASVVVDTRQHPISPPSEPRQYRAIGLVRGTYMPSDEQFNLGAVKTEDGEAIDAVLLGRITSLVKNHIDLSAPHLWVVYPRTREQGRGTLACDLHLQIVGVWEPETLKQDESDPATSDPDTEATTDTEAPTDTEATTDIEASADPNAVTDSTVVSDTSSPAEAVPTSELPDNFFSIRGEILRYTEETEHIVVNIVQTPKQSGKPPKTFRLTVKGTLNGKTSGYFWELNVQRQGSALVNESGTMIGIVTLAIALRGAVPASGPRVAASANGPRQRVQDHLAPLLAVRSPKVAQRNRSRAQQNSALL